MSIILKRQLDAVSQRWYRLKVLKRQALCWLLLLIPAAILAMWLPDSLTLRVRLLILVGITFIGTLLARWKVSTPSAIDAARLIEKKHPEFNDTVLTAVQTSLQASQARSSVLERRTVAEADELARQSDWASVIPGRHLALWTFVSLLSFCVFISGVIAARQWKPALTPPSLVDDDAEEQEIDVQEIVASLEVEPGSTEVERGSPLTVVARFSGSVPVASRCRLTSGSETTLIALDSTVDDGVFATRIPAILGDSEYCIEFAASAEEAAQLTEGSWSGQSDSFQIATFVLPKLLKVDALVRPPAYTQRPEKLIEDTLRITAVEGSMIDLSLLVNKPLAVVELRSSDGEVLPTIVEEAVQKVAAEELPDGNDELAGTQMVSCVLRATKNARFEVYLEDAQGRTSRETQTIILKVTSNKRPKVKVTFPGKDTNVSALQEVLLEAKATDDFGLLDYGIQYSLSNGEMAEISLKVGADQDGDDRAIDHQLSEDSGIASEQLTPVLLPTRQLLSHTVDLESLNAEPDQLLSYSFYVVDTAPDGSQRTTFGDLLFAEIRRYEEIFRESEQQGQQSEQQQQEQQEQQGGAAEELLKLQREIIIATWNVQRDIRDAKSSERSLGNAVKDGVVIQESQQQAVEQLQEAMAEIQDAELLLMAQGAQKTMQQAGQSVAEFVVDPNAEKLTEARSLQQQAFAGLMKMRAKETEIQQSQSQSSSSSSSSSSSQQQMQELELDNERQRYESERQAAEQQQEQQQEAVQVLNRLKELARRQAMMNERIKELESELRAAETEKEKDEIERELKRLQDEQQDLLRDVDEVSQEMQEQDQSAQQSGQQSEQQQQQAQEAQQQLQQAREQVQRTSEALQAKDLQKAISEGTRAERQFDQLQEDFRQQTSSQFSEAMQDLRQQARDLQQNQEDMARELAGEASSQSSDATDADSTDADATDSDATAAKAQKARPSLKAERDKEGIARKIDEQKDRLERILEQAEQVVKAAEESEPLLSRRLYDTLQDSQKERTVDALEATQILMDRGLWNQAQQTEQLVRKGIDELTQGIERAADAVLGSEQESLQRAEQTVQELAKELQQEIARATDAGEQQQGTESGPPSSQDAGGQPSEEANQTAEQGQQAGGQQSENKGQPSNGEGQQGQDGEPGREGKPGGEGQPSDQGQSQQSQPGQGKSGQGQPSEQPGQASQPGQQPSGQQQPGQGQQSSGQPGQGQPSESQQASGQSSGGGPSALLGGGREASGDSASRNAAPLTGEDYRDWSNRLREVEEILDDDELRNQAARVRDRARSIRAEFRRHGKEPEWDLVQSELLDDMLDLQRRIQQQLSGMQSERSLAPIDREPVPEAYNEVVKRYYELLGQSRDSSADQPTKQEGSE